MDIEEKIEKIKKEIRETPYHKATEHHIGKLRAKLARLKEELAQPKKKGKAIGFALKKQGDATCVLLGFPSVGKSTLLNQLTSAKSKVADYQFATVTVIPGMMDYKGAKIQLLDLPGVIEEAAKGKGQGRQILSAVRSADLLLLIIDVFNLDQEKIIQKELTESGIRINTTPPQIIIKKSIKGGIKITSVPQIKLSKETITAIASELGFKNGEIVIKENITSQELIDSLLKNRIFLPAITVVNKIDLKPELGSGETNEKIYISALEKQGFKKLKESIWRKLDLMMVYLQKENQADFNQPLILKKGATVYEAAKKISNELAESINGAYIWENIDKRKKKVGINYKLTDQLIVKFIF